VGVCVAKKRAGSFRRLGQKKKTKAMYLSVGEGSRINADTLGGLEQGGRS